MTNPKRTCAADDCDRTEIKARSLCAKHYHRLQRYGDPQGGYWRQTHHSGDTCRAAGCRNMGQTKGLCNKHYKRLLTHGDISREPAPPIYRYKTDKGYIDVAVNGKRMKEHRYVMEQLLGRPLLPEENVHHRNGRRADNRLENLELWVSMQPTGQRVADLVAFVVEHYRAEVEAALGIGSRP